QLRSRTHYGSYAERLLNDAVKTYAAADFDLEAALAASSQEQEAQDAREQQDRDDRGQQDQDGREQQDAELHIPEQQRATASNGRSSAAQPKRRGGDGTALAHLTGRPARSTRAERLPTAAAPRADESSQHAHSRVTRLLRRHRKRAEHSPYGLPPVTARIAAAFASQPALPTMQDAANLPVAKKAFVARDGVHPSALPYLGKEVPLETFKDVLKFE
ncbi:hypothetical protein FA95DRAFT_1613862, partial [Auriscalpium vulgare]